MKWRFALILVLIATWLLPSLAMAEVIPPGKEQTVLGLLAPHGIDAPADDLGGGATLASVSIDKNAVVITVSAGAASGRLILTSLDARPEGVTGAAATSSKSFSIWRPDAAAGAVGTGLDKLTAAVKRNDDGSFWTTNAVVPEPAPERPSKKTGATVTEAEPETPFGAMAYLLLGLLVVLLAASAPTLRNAVAGLGWKFWIALALIIIVGAGARLQMSRNVPLRKADPAAAGCQEAANCEDGNPCTRDVCEVGECVHIADKALGDVCCVADSDCPEVDDPCVEAFCNLDISQCASRGACGVVADAAQTPEQPEIVLPPSTLATWLYTATGLDARKVGTQDARSYAVVFSTLALLFLALYLAAAGAGMVITLVATFLAALFPSALVTVGSAGVASLVFALVTLALLAAELAEKQREEGGVRLYLSLALFVLATVCIGLQRPEFALLPSLYLVSRALGKPSRRWLMTGLALLPLVAAAIQFFLLSMETDIYAAPQLTLAKRAEITMHALLITGQAVPFLMVLAALVGLIATPRENRALPFFGLLAYLTAFAYGSLLASDALHAVRLGLPLTALLAIPAAYGVSWIGTRPSTYARLSVAILVVYFALFPLVRRNALFTLTVDSQVIELDQKM